MSVWAYLGMALWDEQQKLIPLAPSLIACFVVQVEPLATCLLSGPHPSYVHMYVFFFFMSSSSVCLLRSSSWNPTSAFVILL